MILAVHAVTGAVIGSMTKGFSLIIIFSWLSHYLLDNVPHREYLITNIEQQNFKNSFRDCVRIFLDLMVGCLLVGFIISQKPDHLLSISLGAFFAVVPDGLALSYYIFGKINPNWLISRLLKKYQLFHLSIQRKAGKIITAVVIQIIIVITGLSIVWFGK